MINTPFQRDPNGIPYADKGRLSGFDERLVSEKSPIIELKSTYGLSNIRDVQTTAGSGAIANSNGEYKLSTTASGTDSATLDSAERGRYVPGLGAEAGIGLRAPDTPTGDMTQDWGYFDDNNGFGFGQDATGIYVFTRDGGTTTKVYQTSWNNDTLDGNGQSGITLDLSKGNIFNVVFTWYGYGVIEFQIVIADSENEQQTITVHRFSPSESVSVRDPNLPLRIEIDNGGTATAQEVFVGGRQFSLQGKYMPNRRINGELREGVTVSSTIIPLVTLQRKSAFENVSVKTQGLDIITNNDILVEIRTGTSGLTNASFGTPSNTTASETAVEADNSATAVTGGEIIWRGIVAGGQGGQSQFQGTEIPTFDFTGTDAVSVVARKLSGETDATVSCLFRIREEW